MAVHGKEGQMKGPHTLLPNIPQPANFLWLSAEIDVESSPGYVALFLLFIETSQVQGVGHTRFDSPMRPTYRDASLVWTASSVPKQAHEICESLISESKFNVQEFMLPCIVLVQV